MPERIFVVGHAAVTCLGRDMDSTWRGLIEGRSGIRRHAALGASFLQDLGGMVEGFGPGTTRKIRRSRSSRRGSFTWRWRRRGRPGPTPGSIEGRMQLTRPGRGRDRLGVRRPRPARCRAGSDEPPPQPGRQPLPGPRR